MKSEELDRIDTMPDMHPELKESECRSIGSRWKRNCPKCNAVLVYVNKRSFDQISKINSMCRTCCQVGNGHPHNQN